MLAEGLSLSSESRAPACRPPSAPGAPPPGDLMAREIKPGGRPGNRGPPEGPTTDTGRCRPDTTPPPCQAPPPARAPRRSWCAPGAPAEGPAWRRTPTPRRPDRATPGDVTTSALHREAFQARAAPDTGVGGVVGARDACGATPAARQRYFPAWRALLRILAPPACPAKPALRYPPTHPLACSAPRTSHRKERQGQGGQEEGGPHG
jgi:hypothetical protein